MKEMIIAQLKPAELNQHVYIMTDDSEIIPITVDCTIDELPSVVAMSAAKYKLDLIKVAGPKAYTEKVKDTITEKINCCFGLDNSITVELM